MAGFNILESGASFPANVPTLDYNDNVEGASAPVSPPGSANNTGALNQPHVNLANRTAYLKAHVDTAETDIAANAADIATNVADIGTIETDYLEKAVGGDIGGDVRMVDKDLIARSSGVDTALLKSKGMIHLPAPKISIDAGLTMKEAVKLSYICSGSLSTTPKTLWDCSADFTGKKIAAVHCSVSFYFGSIYSNFHIFGKLQPGEYICALKTPQGITTNVFAFKSLTAAAPTGSDEPYLSISADATKLEVSKQSLASAYYIFVDCLAQIYTP